MNFLTVGSRLNKQIAKYKKDLTIPGQDLPPEVAAVAENMVWHQYRADVKTGLQAYAIFQEELANIGLADKNWYFITIRPSNSIEWSAFLERVKRLIARSCFKDYTLSFEQKGTSTENLGDGFHVHIVANMTQRSKGEVLRDIARTFQGIVDTQYIDVKPTRNPHDVVSKYLIAYESDDGHKETTKSWDTLWRQQHGLQDLYKPGEELP